MGFFSDLRFFFFFRGGGPPERKKRPQHFLLEGASQLHTAASVSASVCTKRTVPLFVAANTTFKKK